MNSLNRGQLISGFWSDMFALPEEENETKSSQASMPPASTNPIDTMQEQLMTAIKYAQTLQQTGQATEEMQRRLDAITELFANTTVASKIADLPSLELLSLKQAVNDNFTKMYQDNFGYPRKQRAQVWASSQENYGHGSSDIPLENMPSKGKGNATKEDYARWDAAGQRY